MLHTSCALPELYNSKRDIQYVCRGQTGQDGNRRLPLQLKGQILLPRFRQRCSVGGFLLLLSFPENVEYSWIGLLYFPIVGHPHSSSFLSSNDGLPWGSWYSQDHFPTTRESFWQKGLSFLVIFFHVEIKSCYFICLLVTWPSKANKADANFATLSQLEFPKHQQLPPDLPFLLQYSQM